VTFLVGAAGCLFGDKVRKEEEAVSGPLLLFMINMLRRTQTTRPLIHNQTGRISWVAQHGITSVEYRVSQERHLTGI
jgi:hypothetical protein